MKDLFRRPQLRALAAVVILYFLLGSIIDLAFFGILGEEAYKENFLLCLAVSDLIIFLAMYFGLYRKKNSFYIPFSERESIFQLQTMIGIVAIGLLMFGLNITVTIAVSILDLPVVQETEDLIYAQSIPLQILTTVVMAPLLEETMCRGVIQGSLYGLVSENLGEKKRAMIAVLFSALIFAAFHAGWVSRLFAFLGGVVFGLLMNRFRDLRVTMAAHALANLFAIIMQNVVLE